MKLRSGKEVKSAHVGQKNVKSFVSQLNRTLSRAPERAVAVNTMQRDCSSVAGEKTSELFERYQHNEITKPMYDAAHGAVNHNLQFFTAKTTEGFEKKLQQDVDSALLNTLPR